MSDSNILIPHLQIQNANALSSPYTIGFPALTAWLGAMHALQRQLNQLPELQDLRFTALGISCHEFDLQTYKGRGDYVHSIIGTGNPLDKDGTRPSFIEAARCHLNVSLIVEFCGLSNDPDEDYLLAAVTRQLHARMKFAGGDVISFKKLSIGDFVKLKKYLMPGYVLIERRDLMQQGMQDNQDALAVLLDYLAVEHYCEQQDEKVHWYSQRKPLDDAGSKGWIVPIATGFHGISELATAKNQRDPDTPHRFAESVITLGQFKMAYQLENPDEFYWRYAYYPAANLYLCEQAACSADQVDTTEEDINTF